LSKEEMKRKKIEHMIDYKYPTIASGALVAHPTKMKLS
jgi:hypothetical protein